MDFEEWWVNKDKGNFFDKCRAKEAWNAAIDEAVKVVDVKDSEFPDSLVQQVIVLIKELKG